MSTTKSPSEFYKMNKQIDDIISAADEATRLSLATLQILKTLKVDTDGTIRFELLEQQGTAINFSSKPATDTNNTSEETDK